MDELIGIAGDVWYAVQAAWLAGMALLILAAVGERAAKMAGMGGRE